MTIQKSDLGPFDVVIVGNGALGLSLGLTLARRNVRVAVLGRPDRPWAASAAAGAMLGTFGEVTTTLLKSEYGRTKLDWAHQATQLWLAELSSESDGSDIVTADGTVIMLNTIGVPGIDDDNYRAIRATLDRFGEPFEDVDPADVEYLDPEPSARPLKAMFIPREHAVDASRLLPQLETALTRAGGMLLPEFATSVEHNAGRVTGVRLESGTTLPTRHLVLAAGAASQTVLDTVPGIAARIPRLISGYGVSALVRDEEGGGLRSVIRTPNRAFACGLHVVPRLVGEVYVGATNIISPEPVSDPAISDVLFLLGCVTRQVRRSWSESGLLKVQVGNRPVALDGMPLLGETDLGGLWMMTGTYRDGLHLSPLLAWEVASRILGEETTIDLDMFHPVRAPIQPLTREEVVEGTVMHMLATGYEHNWNVPVEWPFVIEHYLRVAYTRMADEFDPIFTPPPEILASSRLHPSLTKALREYYAASHATGHGQPREAIG